MPLSHGDAEKLPAVSGSSGHLVIEQPKDPLQAGKWPGQVFADESNDYKEAMLAFVAASREQLAPEKRDHSSPEPTLKEAKRLLHQEERELRDTHRSDRDQRRVEDAAWQEL